MILIECFTDSHIDNIISCLDLRPDRLVFIGSGAEMEDPVKRYRQLLRRKGIDTYITKLDTENKDFRQLYQSLMQLVCDGEDCIIDLTGGQTDVTMAVGAVYAQLPDGVRRRVRIHKYDHRAGTVRDCITGREEAQSQKASLTVEELIELHGGGFRSETHQVPRGSSLRHISGLWELMTQGPREWNEDMKLLGQMESRSVSKTEVFLPLSYLRSSISDFHRREGEFRAVLDKLRTGGIIREESRNDAWSYTYPNPLLRYCTLKAGNILEVKTLLEGRAVTQDGEPYFQDSQMSVTIDWDGVPHKPYDRTPDTRNEVDVVLMRGTTPLFISCKNGNVDENELYKLHTVAHWFGGPYAKKMLIATNLDPEANRGLIRRAKDMGILPVIDPEELTPEGWLEKFREAME